MGSSPVAARRSLSDLRALPYAIRIARRLSSLATFEKQSGRPVVLLLSLIIVPADVADELRCSRVARLVIQSPTTKSNHRLREERVLLK